jgi:hypothetical protein
MAEKFDLEAQLASVGYSEIDCDAASSGLDALDNFDDLDYLPVPPDPVDAVDHGDMDIDSREPCGQRCCVPFPAREEPQPVLDLNPPIIEDPMDPFAAYVDPADVVDVLPTYPPVPMVASMYLPPFAQSAVPAVIPSIADQAPIPAAVLTPAQLVFASSVAAALAPVAAAPEPVAGPSSAYAGSANSASAMAPASPMEVDAADDSDDGHAPPPAPPNSSDSDDDSSDSSSGISTDSDNVSKENSFSF